jgi:hypothetical protein
MSWALLSRRGLEFDYEFGRYPAAVFDVDALGLSPLVDFGRVQGVRLCFASAAGWPPGAGPDAAASGHIACQSFSQLLGVLGVQVDLVAGAVQPEADSAFGLAAVEVIDEEVCTFWAMTGAPFWSLIRCISVGNRSPADA